tara:strand:- start:13392 stop:14366 length:975 start_codon:yes stop_codon:yes gene_type:complete
METFIISLLALALSFNIGANNAGASMATAYGSNSLSKLASVSLIFVFVFLGAAFGGEKVVHTVGKEIVSVDLSTHEFGTKFIFLILGLPVLSILIANILKIPIATTHIVVCTIMGIGLALKEINSQKVVEIVIWWILTPAILWLTNYLIGKHLYIKIINYLASHKNEEKINKILKFSLITSGCFIAFFAGSNNSANAAGPIVAIDLINAKDGALLAGLFMALGAFFFGGRILETVAKEITDICLIRAISVHLTGGLLLCLASFYGIPISLAEIVTAGIIGFSCASTGFSRTLKNTSVSKILSFWIVAPIGCVVLSYIIANSLLR